MKLINGHSESNVTTEEKPLSLLLYEAAKCWDDGFESYELCIKGLLDTLLHIHLEKEALTKEIKDLQYKLSTKDYEIAQFKAATVRLIEFEKNEKKNRKKMLEYEARLSKQSKVLKTITKTTKPMFIDRASQTAFLDTHKSIRLKPHHLPGIAIINRLFTVPPMILPLKPFILPSLNNLDDHSNNIVAPTLNKADIFEQSYEDNNNPIRSAAKTNKRCAATLEKLDTIIPANKKICTQIMNESQIEPKNKGGPQDMTDIISPQMMKIEMESDGQNEYLVNANPNQIDIIKEENTKMTVIKCEDIDIPDNTNQTAIKTIVKKENIISNQTGKSKQRKQDTVSCKKRCLRNKKVTLFKLPRLADKKIVAGIKSVRKKTCPKTSAKPLNLVSRSKAKTKKLSQRHQKDILTSIGQNIVSEHLNKFVIDNIKEKKLKSKKTSVIKAQRERNKSGKVIKKKKVANIKYKVKLRKNS